MASSFSGPGAKGKDSVMGDGIALGVLAGVVRKGQEIQDVRIYEMKE